jgi:hypothetical protein
MKPVNSIILKTLSFIGVAALSIPLIILGLWIHSFNHGTTQAERVSLFDTYFPGFLQGRYDTTYLSMIFCILAIVSSIVCLKLSGKFWKVLNILVLGLSGLLLLLNLFSLM